MYIRAAPETNGSLLIHGYISINPNKSACCSSVCGSGFSREARAKAEGNLKRRKSRELFGCARCAGALNSRVERNKGSSAELCAAEIWREASRRPPTPSSMKIQTTSPREVLLTLAQTFSRLLENLYKYYKISNSKCNY